MHVKKGKSIGAQKGLADELNAIFNWYHTRREGKGFEFDTSDFNSTMYNVLIEPGPGITVTCGGNGQPYIISTTSLSGGGCGGGEGGLSALSVTGTDGSEGSGNHIVIDSDSNVSAYVSDNGSGDINVTLSADSSGELSVVGTDGSTAHGKNITFDNMIGSNLSAHVSDDGNGNVTVKIGVFYL